MSDKLKIGVVGTGAIAETQVDALLAENFPGVAVVAASDVNTDRLQQFGAKYGITGLYPDWQAMLAEADIDAVTVCTPNSLHFGPTMDALRAGKHVLVEKPMSVTAAEAAAMTAEAKKANRLLMIAFQWRFSPEAQMLRKYVKDGTFGDIIYVRAQALRRRGIPSWGVFGRKDIQGGGSLIDIGVHVMEMSHYIMGSPKPKTARGSIHTYIGNQPCGTYCDWGKWDHTTYTVEDLGVGFLTFENGAAMTVETSFAAHIEEDVWTVQVMGTKGGGTTSPAKVFFDKGEYMLTATPAYLETVEPFRFKMRHFCDCIVNGTPCEAPAEDGYAVQQMLEGLYASAETDREITF
ncbi:MAG: Gfo/Idh/MocA family oxidoreductase [Planctomycetaceae bacterium]|nr:Gfo/Idh/MocA family oxidoreductase [Planctomycetaceae bacterium]